MGHDWVFDVLLDLKAYALSNDLTRLASAVDEALQIATEEIVPPIAAGEAKLPDDGLAH
ncbi:MAG: hypothetical protein WCS20_07045 [Alphaproteobacteria bacterium]|jgi:hypothetical protein